MMHLFEQPIDGGRQCIIFESEPVLRVPLGGPFQPAMPANRLPEAPVLTQQPFEFPVLFSIHPTTDYHSNPTPNAHSERLARQLVLMSYAATPRYEWSKPSGCDRYSIRSAGEEPPPNRSEIVLSFVIQAAPPRADLSPPYSLGQRTLERSR